MIYINVSRQARAQAPAMSSYQPQLLAKTVPRYTSYPTAAEFHEGVGAVEHLAGLDAIGEGEQLSLYIHIPYCREICWYCGCNTGAANRSQRLASYLDRLGQEIELLASALAGRGYVTRIAFGGGSPNAIAPEQFRHLVDGLRSAFSISPDAIVSVEIDPRGFDEDFAAALAEAKIQRASLGVQTFSSQVQAKIGRAQSCETIAKAVDLLRLAGVTSLNFDLMYGLPSQEASDLLDSLAISQTMGADRLAVFGYAHVPHLIPRQRKIDADELPGPEARFHQARVAHEALVASDWLPVGFDHFAKAHDPLAVALKEQRVRRNFQGFTDDPCDTLIGLGASAISRLPGLLVQNERNTGRYSTIVGGGQLATMRGIAMPAAECLRARLIEQLLCQGSAEIGELNDRLSVRFRLREFEYARLIHWSGWRLELLSDSLPYARTIAAALDPWRSTSVVQFSNAV